MYTEEEAVEILYAGGWIEQVGFPRVDEESGELLGGYNIAYMPATLIKAAEDLETNIWISRDGAGGEYVEISSLFPLRIALGVDTTAANGQPFSREQIVQLADIGTTHITVDVPHGGIVGLHPVHPIGTPYIAYKYSPGGFRPIFFCRAEEA